MCLQPTVDIIVVFPLFSQIKIFVLPKSCKRSIWNGKIIFYTIIALTGREQEETP